MYIVFVVVTLPLVPVLNGQYEDNSLISLAVTVSTLLSMPLILAALSQFSAAVADTLAAVADTLAAVSNLEEVSHRRFKPGWGYLLVGAATTVLAWTGSTFTVIALASRAFALYYLLQCLVAFNVCRNSRERVRFSW